MSLSTRSVACGLSFAALLLAADVARADGATSTSGCVDDAERGQVLRDERKLVAARALFLRCSQPSCPGAVRRECSAWLDDVTSRLPTIVPSARDAAGNDLSAVRVSLDGALLTTATEGSPFALDPGPHMLRFEDDAGATAEVSIVAREGEQRRIVLARLERPRREATAERSGPTSIPPAPAGRTPVAAYVAGGIGVVALGIATYAGIRGISDYEHLSDTCAPTCAHDDVTAVRTSFWVSTLAGAVGLAAVSVAVAFTLAPSGRGARAARLFPLVPVGGGAAGVGGRISFD